MSNFEWRQEDEEWTDSPQQPTPESPKTYRRLFMVFIITVVFLTAGYVVYQQVVRQLQETESAIQADILASHNIVQTATINGDSELLLSVLSGRLPSWTTAQKEALAAGVLYDRKAWGLDAVNNAPVILSEDDIETPFTLTTSLDLTEAQLKFPIAYQFTTAPGITETVVLSQTAVFRLGARSWLLAPPISDFWGEWLTYEGKYLTLMYPARDTEIAERLALDLEAIVKQICADVALSNCAEAAPFTLRLDSNPESLVDSVDILAQLTTHSFVNMPAPTLFGLPTDDTAYEALLRAYAVPLGTAVYVDIFEWACCHAPVFQVLVNYKLSELDIVPWPVTADDHIRALREDRNFSSLTDYWRSNQTDGAESIWFLSTAIDFIFQQYPDLSSTSLLATIPEKVYVENWLRDAFAQSGYQLGSMQDILQTLQSDWWNFAYTQTLLTQDNEEPPISLPAQDIVLNCMSNTNFDLNTTMSLHRFNLEANDWQEILNFYGFISFNPFINDDGIVIQSLDFNETNQWQTEIWAFDGERTVLNNDEEMFFSLGQFDPRGRFVLTYVGENERPVPQSVLIDLNTCTETECEIIRQDGIPYWSPSGEKTIVSSINMFDSGTAFLRNGSMILFDATQPPQMAELNVGNALGEVPLENKNTDVAEVGYSPFWIDDENFGFIRVDSETDESEVVIKPIDSEEVETVITLADIAPFLPDDVRAPGIIRYVLTYPALPGTLFIEVLDALSREAYVFMYDMKADELDLLIHSQIQPFHSIGLSPNGRWLVLTGYHQEEMRETNTIIIFDIEESESYTYTSNFNSFMLSPLYDWSADGNWLSFFVNDQVLSLVAPAYDYQMVLTHDEGYCISMAWINR
jgi:hypothetical protein